MADHRVQIGRAFWINSLGTLVSRILGLARDISTAALLGLGEAGVMDALVVAFRIANLPRRIFGEGALAASFLPVFVECLQSDRRKAWQLLSALFVWLSAALAALLLLGEAICGLAWMTHAGGDSIAPLIGLTSTMLPYMVFICLAAQASAALQALFSFRIPALAPALLNICWLAGVWIAARGIASDKLVQAYAIAAAVVVSGALQFAVQLPALRRLGYRFEYDWRNSREAFWTVLRTTLPITFGLAVTQLNTLLDSLIAWCLSSQSGQTQTIAWLGNSVSYPMQSGAAAAVYYGERFYQLPVGLLGVAIATVIYPLLSRHAARGDRAMVASDLTLGLRLVWFTALPAGVGIMLLARPIARVLFVHGEFTADDAQRAAGMMSAYASGVWAYCAIPVLVRGYYALGNRATPARVGLLAVAVNLTLNLVLIWPLAERGLAVATSIAAASQVVLLSLLFSRSANPLDWPALTSTLTKGAVASAMMSAAVLACEAAWPAADSRCQEALALAVAIGIGVIAYLISAWILGMPELAVLARRGRIDDGPTDTSVEND